MLNLSKSNKMSAILKATHGSDKTPLIIGDVEIPAYVLNNGMRVLSQNGIQKAIGFSGTTGNWLSSFVNTKQIKPYITAGLLEALANRVVFQRTGAGGSVSDTYGYDATILIDICDAIIDAKNAGTLSESYLRYANKAEIVIRAAAKVGIIALVDEATGYQYEREKDELQKILKAYIASELLPWQKRFPDEFYKEIFRLNGWDYTVTGIKQRPGVIGTWTKKLIYHQLPKGVLKELYEKTPRTAKGKLAAKLHQSLTTDIGNPHLEKQLVSVVTLMNISKDWKEFLRFFNKKFGQQVLDFDNLEEVQIIPSQKKQPVFDIMLTGLLKVPPPNKKG